jgi:hypothetical protein
MKLQNNSLPLNNVLVNHYLPNKVLDRRWLLAIPFAIALISYSVFGMASLASQGQSLPTTWDVVIGVFTDSHIVHHGLNNIFIYLISGIGLTEQLETQIMLRLGSRKDWLKTQIISLLVCTVLYLSLVLLSTLIIALPFVQFSWQWGDFIHAYLGQQGLPAIWLQISPGLTVVFMIILMGMAWIFIGISTVFTTILTQRPVFGFLCGMILNYSAFIIAQTNSLWLQKVWFSRYMFLWNNPVIADSILVHFIVSCLYWAILNAIGLTALSILIKKLDFIASLISEQTS